MRIQHTPRRSAQYAGMWTGITGSRNLFLSASSVTVSCMRMWTPHGTSGREVLCLLHFHSICPMQISFVAWQRVLLTLYQIRSGSIICGIVKQSVYCRPTLTSQGTWHSLKGRNGQWDVWLWNRQVNPLPSGNVLGDVPFCSPHRLANNYMI